MTSGRVSIDTDQLNIVNMWSTLIVTEQYQVHTGSSSLARSHSRMSQMNMGYMRSVLMMN
jgi:hypothetical protein